MSEFVLRRLVLSLAVLGCGALGLLGFGCAGPSPSRNGGNGNALDNSPIISHSDGTISVVAGTGTAGFDGDGGRSAEAQLDGPMDVVVTDDGLLWIADFNNHRIRQIDLTTGIITTVAGDGQTTGSDSLHSPTGITPLADGGFLAAAWGEHRVYQYALDGSRTLFAGDGIGACNGGPSEALAIDQPVFAPRNAKVRADGSVLISEQGCHRVRRVLPDGTIEPYAGTGEPGYSGDDGDLDSAVLATLRAGSVEEGPSFGISLSPENPPDELFIADTGNHVIRQVKLFTGRMETFVGTGEAGYVDGTPDDARFNGPTQVHSTRDHALWVVDTGNHAIRYIDPLRTRVATIAGTGEAGFNGVGLDPAETQLYSPRGIFVTADRDVFIADTGNHCVLLFRYFE